MREVQRAAVLQHGRALAAARRALGDDTVEDDPDGADVDAHHQTGSMLQIVPHGACSSLSAVMPLDALRRVALKQVKTHLRASASPDIMEENTMDEIVRAHLDSTGGAGVSRVLDASVNLGFSGKHEDQWIPEPFHAFRRLHFSASVMVSCVVVGAVQARFGLERRNSISAMAARTGYPFLALCNEYLRA